MIYIAVGSEHSAGALGGYQKMRLIFSKILFLQKNYCIDTLYAPI